MGGELLTVTARVRLNWSAPAHWSEATAGCRRCGTATHGRDAHGRACHQTCAEEELAAEMAGQFRVVDERVLPSGGWRRPGGAR